MNKESVKKKRTLHIMLLLHNNKKKKIEQNRKFSKLRWSTKFVNRDFGGKLQNTIFQQKRQKVSELCFFFYFTKSVNHDFW